MYLPDGTEMYTGKLPRAGSSGLRPAGSGLTQGARHPRILSGIVRASTVTTAPEREEPRDPVILDGCTGASVPRLPDGEPRGTEPMDTCRLGVVAIGVDWDMVAAHPWVEVFEVEDLMVGASAGCTVEDLMVEASAGGTVEDPEGAPDVSSNSGIASKGGGS